MFKERRQALKMLIATTVAMASSAGWVADSQAQKKAAEKVELPVIAAAADLQFPLEEIAQDFERATRQKLRLTFGSSGNFYRQLMEGAPFEMFLSADEDFVLRLADAGKTVDKGEIYGIGRLALYTPSGSLLKADNFLSDIRNALRDGRLQNFAIANPEHAPYGRLAEQVLRRKQVWDEIQPKLVMGENIAQAAQFAVSGSTQGGLVAYSQAARLMGLGGGKCVLVSETLYEPLKQRMVLLNSAGPVTRDFYRYMQSNKAKDVLKRYGFLMPGDAPKR